VSSVFADGEGDRKLEVNWKSIGNDCSEVESRREDEISGCWMVCSRLTEQRRVLYTVTTLNKASRNGLSMGHGIATSLGRNLNKASRNVSFAWYIYFESLIPLPWH
jgi:hypothetical protein